MKSNLPTQTGSGRSSLKTGMAGVWSLFTVAILGTMTYISLTLSGTSMSIADQNMATLIVTGKADAATMLALVQIEELLDAGGDVPLDGKVTHEGAELPYTTRVLAGPNVLTHESQGLPMTVTVIGIEATATLEDISVTSRRVLKITQASDENGKPELISLEETSW